MAWIGFVVLTSAKLQLNDPRLLANGRLMASTGYMDQPYVALVNPIENRTALSRWVVAVTQNPAHEGKTERITVYHTEDQGLSWTGPINVAPDLVKRHIDHSYSAIVAGSGNNRLWVVCGANLNNISKLPSGQPTSRTDELGFFILVTSADGGATWSNHSTIPLRSTALDRSNTFGGTTQIFWNVDQIKERNGTAYLMYTKIGRYTQNPPEQGFVLASENLLSAASPAEVNWQLLPSGDEGPGAPPGFDVASTVAEEWHVIPLLESAGFAAVYRTNVGLLGAAWTPDASGAGGWATGVAQFAWGLPSNASSTDMRNPRGPITVRRFPGALLMLWYNNGAHGFGAMGCEELGSGNGNSQRNPYWLSAARETTSGRLEFTQPEVALYVRDMEENGHGPGYPDIFQDRDGSYWIAETQKVATRFHRIDEGLVHALAGQFTASAVAQAGLVGTYRSPGTVPTPPALFPDFAAAKAQVVGFTIALWLRDSVVPASGGRTVVGTEPTEGEAAWGETRVHIPTSGHGIAIFMRSGGQQANASLTTDPMCSAALARPGPHFVAFVADGGPRILTVMVDGKLCDGGGGRIVRGWSWFDPALGSVRGERLQVAASPALFSVRMYDRPLRTSELVGNWRAGAGS